eukprot:jgi/Tetstr1/442905/TSEL_030968.t1
MDCIPRTISRAQAFDALSSMANIAGYRAVVEATHAFGRFLGGQMTAAGKVNPAKVLVIGGGVAGLAAIVQAKNLGAIVRCFDKRPVECACLRSSARRWTIIITTALIPGKKAPVLITKEMVDSMQAGSVTSSQLYGNNVFKFLDSMGPKGRLGIDHEDAAVRGALLTEGGALMWPAPALPTPRLLLSLRHSSGGGGGEPRGEGLSLGAEAHEDARSKALSLGLLGAALLAVGWRLRRFRLTEELTTLALAGLGGYNLVWALVPHTAPGWLAALSVGLSCVNIFGGFVMTDRMLGMFKREGDVDATGVYVPMAAGLLGTYAAAAAATSGNATSFAAMTEMAYLTSGLACLGAIGGLSSQSTAGLGNKLGITGMLGVVGVGGATGFGIAKMVEVTELPQLVAAFHSLVGFAASATSVAGFLTETGEGIGALDPIHKWAIYAGAAIGSITLTGSLVAFAKLQGLVKGQPLSLPGKGYINLAMLASILAAGTLYNTGDASTATSALLGATAIAGMLGLHMTASVGARTCP